MFNRREFIAGTALGASTLVTGCGGSSTTENETRSQALSAGSSGVTRSAWAPVRDAGSIQGDTWFPARGQNGVISQASINALQSGRWYNVHDTRLDALHSQVIAVMPTWRDRGNSRWNAVLDNWCSLAWDKRHGLEKAYMISSGGHFDGANTGVFSFDARRMRFNIEVLPLPDEILDPRWNVNWLSQIGNPGSFTAYPTSWEYYVSNPGNPEGVYYDEIWIPSMGIRRPTPRHTYESQVFVPHLGAAGKILMSCRRYWEYDIATKTFDTPKFPFGSGVGYGGSTGYTGENMMGFWNEAEQRYYVTPTQNYNQSTSYSCKPGGTDWRWESGFPFGGWPAYNTSSDQNGDIVYSVMTNRAWNTEGAPYRIVTTNMRTRQQTNLDIVLGATFNGKTFGRYTYWDTGSCTFVPEWNGWIIAVYTVETGECLAFVNSSGLCDIMLQDGQPIRTQRLEGKCKYIAGLVYLIDRSDRNIRVMKP